MDIEWFQNLYKNPRFRKYGVYLLILIIILFFADKVATLSDIGFSDEIKHYRWIIIFAIVIFCIILALVIEFITIRREKTFLESEAQNLKVENEDLQKQKESLFRLMEAYRVEAQEDIFNRLKQLAVFSIKREQWKAKAKVERFRIENLSKNSEEINIIDRTTVIINLGKQDEAMKGMQFLVQDPTDNAKYGVIRIEECFDAGSSCSIIELNHPAFWSEVVKVNGSMETEERIIDAPTNIIVPYTPFKELNTESAKQIVEWIQNLEDVEL